jgi:hypothetical protein
MTKILEREAKRHHSRTRERTKHEQVRDAHREFASKPRANRNASTTQARVDASNADRNEIGKATEG